MLIIGKNRGTDYMNLSIAAEASLYLKFPSARGGSGSPIAAWTRFSIASPSSLKKGKPIVDLNDDSGKGKLEEEKCKLEDFESQSVQRKAKKLNPK